MKTTAENALTAKLFKNGDSKVFQMCYLSLLYKLLPMVKGNMPLAQDLAMEVLEKSIENMDSYNPKYALSTWLHKICKNHFLDYLKMKRINKFTVAFSKLEDENEPYSFSDRTTTDRTTIDFGSSDQTPEEILISKERKAQIIEALNKLERLEFKQAFMLRHFQGYTLEEIVNIMKTPINIVKSYIIQARKLMMVEIVR